MGSVGSSPHREKGAESLYHLLNRWQLRWRPSSPSLISKAHCIFYCMLALEGRVKFLFLFSDSFKFLCGIQSSLFRSRRKTWFGPSCGFGPTFFFSRFHWKPQKFVGKSFFYMGKISKVHCIVLCIRRTSCHPVISGTHYITNAHKSCSEPGLKACIKLSLVLGKSFGWRNAAEVGC